MASLKHKVSVIERSTSNRNYWLVQCLCGMTMEAIDEDGAKQVKALHLQRFEPMEENVVGEVIEELDQIDKILEGDVEPMRLHTE